MHSTAWLGSSADGDVQAGVGYVLWTEVFSPESKVTYFNSAVNRIKKDHRCLELLGDSSKIMAHGDETRNKWKRARPIRYVRMPVAPSLEILTTCRSSETTDARGNQHIVMQFYVCTFLRLCLVHKLTAIRSRARETTDR